MNENIETVVCLNQVYLPKEVIKTHSCVICTEPNPACDLYMPISVIPMRIYEKNYFKIGKDTFIEDKRDV